MHCTPDSTSVEQSISQDSLKGEFNRFVHTFNYDEHREPSRFECYRAAFFAGAASMRLELAAPCETD
jgi:hypothetical protein